MIAARNSEIAEAVARAQAMIERMDARETEERRFEALTSPVGKRASEIKPERVSWLWRGRLACGKLTVLDADPGTGKSTLTMEVAARVSRGEALPGGTASTPGGVIVVSAEDGPADTIVPRLIAARADLDQVFIMEGSERPDGQFAPVSIPGGLDAIEKAIWDYRAALVILDPLMALLGGDVGANRDQDVRRARLLRRCSIARTQPASSSGT
jgi:RecA-family ATPase